MSRLLVISTALGLLVVLAGCPDTGEDNDYDGFNELVDCNDADASVYPGHPELCDGQDNDCDGLIDEEIEDDAGEVGYFDADGDGFGDPDREETFCDGLGEGFVPVGGDCDDEEAAVNPDAIEDCTDGIDNDCDGEIDEDEDADGDGVSNCAGDCDDDDPDVFPGADELCDGLDNNCDEAIDEGFDDLDGDGSAVCVDCDDDNADVFPGAPEVCDSVDNECDGLIDEQIDEDGDGTPTDCGGTAGGQVDFLVVIDNSCSMEDEQDALDANGESLFTTAFSTNADLSVAVINTSEPTFIATIDSATPNAADVFGAAVVQGNDGNNIEQPFLRALEALELQPDWHRPGAGLSLLVLSDEDDQSPVLMPDVILGLAEQVSEIAFLEINHISGLVTGCNGDSGNAIPAPRLVVAGAITGGKSESICELDWDLGSLLPDEIPVDCDDTNPDVFPGATEACDGIDNNCDGAVDEDGDGDGFTVCDDDCDDGAADVFPGNPEICDGLDNDCDGAVPGDEGDGDGDGHLGCADCDDASASAYPGAPETCGDGTDQDCDGSDVDPDGGDSDGDGIDVCAGDCNDANALVFPGAPEHSYNGVDDDCDGLVDTLDPDEVLIHNAETGMTDTHLIGGGLISSFTLCGEDHDIVWLSSDGFLLFGEGPAVFDNTPSVAELDSYAPIFAPLWVDLYPPDGGLVAFIYRPDGSHTFSWIDIPVTGSGGDAVSLDVTLEADDTMTLNVRDGVEAGAFMGLSCGDAVEGSFDASFSIDLSATPGGIYQQLPGPSPTGTWTITGL